ncbi:MAG: HEAT repeat domain-containing protein [Candidatus Latescibacteria bacterium]|jgi:hypothetical protein|nr:HEAT repeat domain-containing protein [Candidatus Latescibacterota bacterium]MBT4137405.1 HEAT repeat domain-containing protein [Candidatus Latescibacterota bacterium]MBT5828756.1 HEAT repeat domain-containing protein [Candidatus Latescibacterota bacterium]
MRCIWVAIWAIAVVCGCAKEQTADVEIDVASMQTQFLDQNGSVASRVALGRVLVAHEAGRAFLVTQYGSGRRYVVQAVVDSIIGDRPVVAAQLLAELMAAAGGEAKLHFEAQLITLGEPATPVLVELAKSETDWQTMMRTLDALGKLKAKQGRDVMAAQLHHSNDWVRIAAAHALGDLGDLDGVPALVGALEDTSDTVISAALVGLGKVGDLGAVQVCGQKLKHKNPRVRAAAVSALGRIGGVEAKGFLDTALKDPDSGVRFKAQGALDKITKNAK